MKYLVILSVLISTSVLASDDICLGCHYYSDLEKTLGDGKVLSLKIDRNEFERSVHGPLGCSICHDEDPEKGHPTDLNISSKKEYSKLRSVVCSNCHIEKFEINEKSIHTKMRGKKVCSDCHKPHEIQRKTDSAQQESLLNMSLGLALLSGLLVPIGHKALGWIAKR